MSTYVDEDICPRCGAGRTEGGDLPGACMIAICEIPEAKEEEAPTPAEIPPHPAKWSASVLSEIEQIVIDEADRIGRPVRVLDPFAGRGLPELREACGDDASIVAGVELEPEWAAADPQTIVADATALPADWTDAFDLVVTSPCYGNRMADHHEARDDSSRITYRHKLGRMPSGGSGAVLQWGPRYRTMHSRAWEEARRVLRPGRHGTPGKDGRPRVLGGLAVINVSNHIRTRVRNGERVEEEQPVVEWHINEFLLAGCTVEQIIKVPTPRMGFGQNGDARVDGERILVLRMPDVLDGSLF